MNHYDRLVDFWEHCSRAMQLVYVSMVSMATMDIYGLYGALLQTPIEGPGFADGAWLCFHSAGQSKAISRQKFIE